MTQDPKILYAISINFIIILPMLGGRIHFFKFLEPHVPEPQNLTSYSFICGQNLRRVQNALLPRNQYDRPLPNYKPLHLATLDILIILLTIL